MSSAFFIPTSNEDVVLRHLTVEDSTPYFEAIERSKDHLSRMGYLTAVNNETMDKVVQNITNPKNSKRTSMGIWDTTKFIGEVSLTPREVPYSLPEVESGVWVDTQFRGNGYERLALSALSKFVKPKFPYIYSLPPTRKQHVGHEVVVDRRGNVVADGTYIENFFAPARSSFANHRLDSYRQVCLFVFCNVCMFIFCVMKFCSKSLLHRSKLCVRWHV